MKKKLNYLKSYPKISRALYLWDNQKTLLFMVRLLLNRVRTLEKISRCQMQTIVVHNNYYVENYYILGNYYAPGSCTFYNSSMNGNTNNTNTQ